MKLLLISLSKNKLKLKHKFLKHFPKGFADKKYIAWERDYKWQAHLKFEELLNRNEFERLLKEHNYREIAYRAVKTESKTNLLFSFEKMALRDAVKSEDGAQLFAKGLYEYIYGEASLEERFNAFAEMLSLLPRKQTRVRTWPLQTVFGFIANPKEFIFLKPRVTQEAAKKYGFEFNYFSKPNWATYKSYLDFVKQIKHDFKLNPRDMIDMQSIIWTMGSEEY